VLVPPAEAQAHLLARTEMQAELLARPAAMRAELLARFAQVATPAHSLRLNSRLRMQDN
jgi:hypothetical protein